jgi:hypothetical protein
MRTGWEETSWRRSWSRPCTSSAEVGSTSSSRSCRRGAGSLRWDLPSRTACGQRNEERIHQPHEQRAWLAGAHGVPTLLVVGDDATKREANALLPGVKTVSVKTSVDRKTAECRPVDEVWREIESAAGDAVANVPSAPVSTVEDPVQIAVFLAHPSMLEPAKAFRGVSFEGESGVRFSSDTFVDAWFRYQTIARACAEFGLYKEASRRFHELDGAKEIASEITSEFSALPYREGSSIPGVKY